MYLTKRALQYSDKGFTYQIKLFMLKKYRLHMIQYEIDPGNKSSNMRNQNFSSH